jgi:hypothetical protein
MNKELDGGTPICYHDFNIDLPCGIKREGCHEMLPMKEFLFMADDYKTLFCFSGIVKNEGDFFLNLIDLKDTNPVPIKASKIEGEAKQIFKTYF